MKKHIPTLLTLIAIGLHTVAVTPAHAASSAAVLATCRDKPSTESCQNKSPLKENCVRGAKVLARESIRRSRQVIGRVELWQSDACKTKFARTLVYREAGRNLEVSATLLVGRDASVGVDVSSTRSVFSNMVFLEDDGVLSASGLISRAGGIAYGATTEDR